jgi:hypothetical protein
MLLAIRNSNSSAKFICALQLVVHQSLWSAESWTGQRRYEPPFILYWFPILSLLAIVLHHRMLIVVWFLYNVYTNVIPPVFVLVVQIEAWIVIFLCGYSYDLFWGLFKLSADSSQVCLLYQYQNMMWKYILPSVFAVIVGWDSKFQVHIK